MSLLSRQYIRRPICGVSYKRRDYVNARGTYLATDRYYRRHDRSCGFRVST